jgi:hypothetical protein
MTAKECRERARECGKQAEGCNEPMRSKFLVFARKWLALADEADVIGKFGTAPNAAAPTEVKH